MTEEEAFWTENDARLAVVKFCRENWDFLDQQSKSAVEIVETFLKGGFDHFDLVNFNKDFYRRRPIRQVEGGDAYWCNLPCVITDSNPWNLDLVKKLVSRTPPIAGMTYLPSFLTEEEQANLLQTVDYFPWLNDLKRRVQHYGYKYDYTTKVVRPDMSVGPLPDQFKVLARKMYDCDILSEMPDQLIVNEYLPGQGIAPHIDCVPCFKDNIVSISLGDTYVMDFTKGTEKISIPLAPGSLLKLTGESRYKWRHSIASRKKDGDHVRSRRVSLTFRQVILSDA